MPTPCPAWGWDCLLHNLGQAENIPLPPSQPKWGYSALCHQNCWHNSEQPRLGLTRMGVRIWSKCQILSAPPSPPIPAGLILLGSACPHPPQHHKGHASPAGFSPERDVLCCWPHVSWLSIFTLWWLLDQLSVCSRLLIFTDLICILPEKYCDDKRLYLIIPIKLQYCVVVCFRSVICWTQ